MEEEREAGKSEGGRKSRKVEEGEGKQVDEAR